MSCSAFLCFRYCLFSTVCRKILSFTLISSKNAIIRRRIGSATSNLARRRNQTGKRLAWFGRPQVAMYSQVRRFLVYFYFCSRFVVSVFIARILVVRMAYCVSSETLSCIQSSDICDESPRPFDSLLRIHCRSCVHR